MRETGTIPYSISTPCGGGIAFFDGDSGIGYRCATCNAIIGSIGMPKDCKEIFAMEEMVEKLKGKNNGR